MEKMTLHRPRVLIVGAGPVGLALAIELGHRAIPCLLIERNDRVGYAPRAKTTNVRTREHFRRWGIADTLRKASPLGMDYPSNVVFCTRLSGFELTRFENALYCAPGRNPLYSEHSQWVPQYTVEEVMRAHAQSLPGVEVLVEPAFGERLLGAWNLRPTDKTRPWLASGLPPPGGETEEDFVARIDGAVRALWPLLDRRPLLVGSRGVARAIGVLLNMPGRVDLANGALIEFDLASFENQATVWDEL